jgi:hypothetical protein
MPGVVVWDDGGKRKKKMCGWTMGCRWFGGWDASYSAFAGLEKTASRGQRLLRFEGETVGAARPDVIGLLV